MQRLSYKISCYEDAVITGTLVWEKERRKHKMNYVTLNNGVKMPVMGIGTYLLVPDDAENAVEIALKNGYELIDTANAYVNEKAVGRGMKKSGVSRDKIFS